MPIIRYRTRDLTRLLPGTARTMRRMEKITGRSDDMMIIRGINVFPTQIEELILKQESLAPHYQIELSRDGRLDTMLVLAELKPGIESSDALRAKLARELQHHIKSFIGISTQVVVTDVGGVPRSQGKGRAHRRPPRSYYNTTQKRRKP